jgi:nucleoid-associated protein
MKLEAIIVHKIDKEANGVPKIKEATRLLPTGPNEAEFLKEVRSVYYSKSNPIYGVFDDDRSAYPFQKTLKSYLEKKKNFLEFSRLAVEQLKRTMITVPASTGGYILFAHYKEGGEEFVMTIMINSKEKFNINDSLLIQQIRSIDIEKLDVASLVNINRWRKKEDTYLSFARGRKDVSNYFMAFIGCTSQTDAKEQSTRLRRAITDYVASLDLNHMEKEELKNAIHTYCISQISDNRDISLPHISSIINSEEPDAFRDFAAREQYSVSADIRGHRAALQGLKYYYYRGNGLTIKFNNDLVANKTIRYNKKDNTIVIRHVPKELSAQFDRDVVPEAS